ncbi:MAG: type I-U CRISPR-associated protein Csx17, partial [Alicyclobacillus sp.]|nr:type I-U CRISPR-associated protein Csx17 [Alicyclobacillus sp.]
EAKETFLGMCRAELPDEAVEFLDATIVMTNKDLRFPPLLGTGGTDGNLDFTNNFMQRVLDVISPDNGKPTPQSAGWLRAALFGGSAGGMMKAAIGQLSPGGVGGPNARAGFAGESLVNPWDFILMLEGTLVFAAAATKRLEVGRNAVMSYPFTVYPTGAGYGGIAEQDENPSVSRAEMWLPLWRGALSFREVAAMFREGRAQVGSRTARNGIEFARACAALAVDRGVDSFQRFSFLKRSGKSYLAVPLNRFRVTRRSDADVLNDLDRTGWLDSIASLARSSESGALSSAYRNVMDAIMQLCQHGGAYRTQQLLIAMGQVEKLLAKRPKARESVKPLVLRSTDWLKQAAQHVDAEFHLAASIAGMRSANQPHIRAYFSPVKPSDPANWDVTVSPRVVWQDSDLTRNLTALIHRRLLDWESLAKIENPQPQLDQMSEDVYDPDKPLDGAVGVPLSSIVAYLQGRVNEQRVDDLIWGLLPLAASGALYRWAAQNPFPIQEDASTIPWAYLVTKLVALPNRQWKLLMKTSEITVPLPPRILALLTSGSSNGLSRASEVAERRLLASGVGLRHRGVSSPGLSGPRCAAALAFPISMAGARRLLNKVTKDTSVSEQFQAEESEPLSL